MMTMWTGALFIGLAACFVSGQSLLTLMPKDERNTYKGCLGKSVVSCDRADLDIDILKTGDSIKLPDETTLTLNRRGENVAVFKNAEAEGIFTWNGEHVAGNVHVRGESWVLEGCGDQCFLWIKQTNAWLDEGSAPDSKLEVGFPSILRT
eukprot:TRINITY_DN22065_c0_g1_i1.p1 TRINITY_DN22065_c0_g1~~TRINITY_DN22065_c0_g1_i1.p1  ORF type:complete len:150 (-),score=24.18 TRINITY_DN22065_c0_g1_i1:202-651(-)